MRSPDPHTPDAAPTDSAFANVTSVDAFDAAEIALNAELLVELSNILDVSKLESDMRLQLMSAVSDSRESYAVTTLARFRWPELVHADSTVSFLTTLL